MPGETKVVSELKPLTTKNSHWAVELRISRYPVIYDAVDGHTCREFHDSFFEGYLTEEQAVAMYRKAVVSLKSTSPSPSGIARRRGRTRRSLGA